MLFQRVFVIILPEEAKNMDASKTGALIRQLRVSRGMTQREVARQLMVSEQAVS